MTTPRAPSGRDSWQTLVRGLRLTPELRCGLALTLGLTLVAAGGRVVVPVALQRVVDNGLVAAGGALNLGVVLRVGALALGTILATAAAGRWSGVRLAQATENALANLRIRAFRHLHDLSALHLAGQQRGALVARVTADVDIISQFMQWGGPELLASLAQLAIATAVMTYYSPPLTLLAVGVFVPLAVALRLFQRRLRVAFDAVRLRVSSMFGALAESVVGAEVIRAYGIEERTRQRVDATIDDQFAASFRAARLGALMFASGELVAAAATAAVVVAGVMLGVGDRLQPGELLAFLFLVTLFVGPIQLAVEVLNEAQTAIAGWRRVLDLLDVAPDVADPGIAGEAPDLSRGVEIRFDRVTFAYPQRVTPTRIDAVDRAAGEPVLHDIDLTIPAGARVAIVGQTGSGKSTFAKLLTRLMDPSRGRVCLNGVDLRSIAFQQLRSTVLLVPQDGFLFNTTIGENIAYGHPGLGDQDIVLALTELGLADWIDNLPHGLDTRVGERGGALSAGERQLVALARAYVANPKLLVLDEATSAVDPATDVRLRRAIEGLTAGRTSVTIAHRLSTAQAADDILVFDGGRIVQRGPHEQLVEAPGVYARLHQSWVAGSVTKRSAATMRNHRAHGGAAR